MQSLCQLKLLRHVDVSQCNESRGQFKDPAQFMESLVTSLPCLESLDISGTNLAGTGPERNSKRDVICDIPGLRSRYSQSQSSVSSLNSSIIHRMDRPLQFLGLYKTHNDASGRHLIPARVISGDTDESQILVAGQRYLDRPTVLESILNDLFHVLRYLVMSPRSDLLPSYFQI